MYKILIVDDNKYIRITLSAIVEESGYEALTAENGKSILKTITSKKPDLIILDKRLPGQDGIELLREIRQIHPELPVIILTAYADEISAGEAVKLGAMAFLTKPFDNLEIISCINKALGKEPGIAT